MALNNKIEIMDTKKTNMPPAVPGINQEEDEKNKVSKGGAIGAAVGVGVAAAAGGAVAGATVISDALGKSKHHDRYDDEDEQEENENDGYYDDDKDLDKDNNDDISPENRRRDPDDDDRQSKGQRDKDADKNAENNNENDNNKDDNGGASGNSRENENDNGNIDDRADKIIEGDQIEVNNQDGEWSPVGWRTITDQDGNEVNGMLFEDGNGGYVLITEGDPGSGIYDVAMNPNNGEAMPIDEQFAFTRGDLEAIIDPDGGYIAPGAEDEIFASNDDINQDIIVTDDGELTAQRDMPGDNDTDGTDGNDDQIIEEDEYAMASDEVVVDDQELEQYLGEDELAEVNEEPVEFVDNSEELVADNTYLAEDSYDASMEMEADLYDDTIDMA